MAVLALVNNIDPDFALLGHHFRGGTFDHFFEILGADFPGRQQIIGF